MRKTFTAAFAIMIGIALSGSKTPSIEPIKVDPQPKASPRIQAAILLDVSGSMEGLIEQAKAQLWNMVSVMGKVKCEEGAPQIEIALYEYGRPSNGATVGFVKQLSPFSSDLSFLSQELFKLKTDGGDEYCGQVIYSSLSELAWDTASGNYKVIFIAGNEDFLQGNITYTEACKEAKKKGVIVNTIYCGDRLQGIREHWDLAGECGNGSFSHIDQNRQIEDIPTPYDSTLFVLNDRLNATRISYGQYGSEGLMNEVVVDAVNMKLSSSVAAKRVTVKGNKQLYTNSSWDLVDAMEKDKQVLSKIERKDLNDSLQKMNKAEIEKVILAKSRERAGIQKQIGELSVKRDNYITAERIKKNNQANAVSLESEIEKTIKMQVKRFNMTIE